MRILAIVAGLALAGCAQQQARSPGPEIHQSCGVADKPFTESWPCVRTGVASIKTYPDVRDLYIATGDHIATQVREGKMTDSEAKMAIAEARQRANSVTEARKARDADREAASDAAIIGAWMNRPQPQQAPAPTPMIYAPLANQMINCNRIGNTVQCY